MSRQRRRKMVDRQHPALSTVRQCALLDISRSSLYYRPKEASLEDLAVMKAIDQQYLVTPFYGSQRMRVWLGRQGHQVSRKRVQRLMRTVGLTAIYRRPRTSQPAPGHKVYPCGMEIARPNQVWATNITYIPMTRGFMLCGNMCCGVVKDDLMIRVGPENHERSLALPYARPMDFTGRPMKGFVYVTDQGVNDDDALSEWVNRGVAIAQSLPAK